MGYLKGLSRRLSDHPDYLRKTRRHGRYTGHGQGTCRLRSPRHRLAPKSFRRRPKLLAPAWCMFEMFWSALQAARRGDAQLIHARSYLPAAAGWAVTASQARLSSSICARSGRRNSLRRVGCAADQSSTRFWYGLEQALPARCSDRGITDRGGGRVPKATVPC